MKELLKHMEELDAHIPSWAGFCPGDNESVKKRRIGKTRKGNYLLRTILIACALIAYTYP